MYGLGIHSLYPHYTPIPYRPEISFKQIVDLIQPHVIIIAQKSRMFSDYSVKGKDNKTWLPEDFKDVKVPKIVIEEDYHYEENDDWYKENNIKLILQRHYSQSLRQNAIPMMWFPFSIDDTIFRPIISAAKINKICFTGTISTNVYKYRYKAIKILSKNGLIDVFSGKEKIFDDYIKNLQEYRAHLSCGSIYDTTPAKCVEIIASGSLLFTNRFIGIEHLLPANCYCGYDNDLSDVLDKAKMIINNNDYVREVNNSAYEHVSLHHTHYVRANQLIAIIKDIL